MTDIGGRSFWLVSADLNNDQKLDALVTVDTGLFVDTKLLLLTGNGDGTFGGPQQIDSDASAGTLFAYSSPALGDFNKDGKVDVAAIVSFLVGSGSEPYPVVRVLLGNGNGTFQAAQDTILTTFRPYALFAADLNGDGFPDVVIANPDSNNVSVLLNTPGLANSPNFSITAASPQLSLTQGGETTDTLTISPQNGAFTETIDLTCSIAGPAPLPSCAVSPTSVVPGADPTEVALSITVAKSAWLMRGWIDRFFALVWPLVLALIGIFLLGYFFASDESATLTRDIWKASTFAILLIFLLVGCGGGGTDGQGKTALPPVQSQIYTATVTAASGTIQHTTQVTVTVQ